MLLMIFARHHLSTVLLPIFGASVSAQINSPCSAWPCQGCRQGRAGCAVLPARSGRAVTMGVPGREPTPKPTRSPEGMGRVGRSGVCGGSSPTAPTAPPPTLGKDISGLSHGKALFLHGKHWVSIPFGHLGDVPKPGDTQGPLVCASSPGCWVCDSIINPHPSLKSAEWKAIPWRSRCVQRGI